MLRLTHGITNMQQVIISHYTKLLIIIENVYSYAQPISLNKITFYSLDVTVNLKLNWWCN